MIRQLSIPSIVVLLFTTVTVHAESGTTLTIAPGFMDFDYVETASDGTFLDSEIGVIPGFRLGLDVSKSHDLNLGFKFEYYRGLVDYNGHLQSVGPNFDPNVHMLPFQTETEETVYSFSGYLLKHFNSSRTGVSLYGALMLKMWDRDIQSKYINTTGNLGDPVEGIVPSTFEQYQWWQLDLGLQYKWLLGSKSSLQLYGGVLRTINPTMKVSVSTLELQEKWGYKLGIEWLYKLTNQHSIGLGSDYTFWEFGRSDWVYDPVEQSDIREPDSESNMLAVQFIYQYHY